jgi:hypothetical protein
MTPTVRLVPFSGLAAPFGCLHRTLPVGMQIGYRWGGQKYSCGNFYGCLRSLLHNSPFFFDFPMRPNLRSRLGTLLVLLLPVFSGHAQSADSVGFLRHTLHLFLTPGTGREVQFSYERAFSPASALEVVLGTKLASNRHDFQGRNHMILGGYDDRVFVLPYENSFSAGVFWKGSLSPTKRRGFIPFVTPGILYRYGFFNDKCYGESSMSWDDAFGQEFSLRKHEVTARLQFGLRHHFYSRSSKSAFSTEASLDIGGGKRFGEFLNVRRFHGSSDCPPDSWRGSPIEPKTSSFDVDIMVFPVNVKIGYSWGG